MTKPLSPTEKYNRAIDRHLKAIRNINCGVVNCKDCILNNFGDKSRENIEKHGYYCGRAGILNAIRDYRENFKQL
jgi:hypothetical protein